MVHRSTGPSDLLPRPGKIELVLVKVMAPFGLGSWRQHGGVDRARVLGSDDLGSTSASPSIS